MFINNGVSIDFHQFEDCFDFFFDFGDGLLRLHNTTSIWQHNHTIKTYYGYNFISLKIII
jgi:hypothetical protein